MVALLGVAACARAPGRRGALDEAVAPPTPWPRVAEPAPWPPEATAAWMQEGLDGLERVVAGLARTAPPAAPLFYDPATFAEGVERRYGRDGFGGPVRHALGIALRARVPTPPAHLADLLTEPALQRTLLDARRVELLGSVRALGPGRSQASYLVEKADVGAGPIRVTLVFRVTVERYDAPDGTIWVRYDPRPGGDVRYVTYWRGLARIDPDPQGALLSEVLLVGTDLAVPPFLTGVLRDLARDTLKSARRGLLARAAASPAPAGAR